MCELVFELFDLIVVVFFEFDWNVFGISERMHPISDSENLSYDKLYWSGYTESNLPGG